MCTVLMLLAVPCSAHAFNKAIWGPVYQKVAASAHASQKPN